MEETIFQHQHDQIYSKESFYQDYLKLRNSRLVESLDYHLLNLDLHSEFGPVQFSLANQNFDFQSLPDAVLFDLIIIL